MPARLPMIIAHRGASGYRPEHTQAAYRLAFRLGADAVEPDMVPTKDGILVVRHENEISGTTNVAQIPEFAGRRTTKEFARQIITGWFTEDFTWQELSTLRARERLPQLRPHSARFNDKFPILRLSDLFTLVAKANDKSSRLLRLVAELKHAAYFQSIGLPLDELFINELDAAGWSRHDSRLVVESFELSALTALHGRGVDAKRVFLLEATGAPMDEVLSKGAAATPYSDYLTPSGLYGLSGIVDGVSVDKNLLLTPDDASTAPGGSELVDAAHAALLDIYCWTLRPENEFLGPEYRTNEAATQFGNWHDEFARIFSTGVDAVFADHPDLALTVRDGSA